MTTTKRLGHSVPMLAAALVTTALCLCRPAEVRAQWATNGNDINNTNTGKVGIGTTAPSTKLDVAGTTKSDAFSVGGFSAEKAFQVLWNNGVANQKVQVYWPASTQVDGIFEVTVTGHYWYSNSNGGIRKRIVINGRNIGVINMEQSEVPFRLGLTGNSDTISDIMWDAANSRYYFIVSNLDNAQNAITIHVKSITPGATPANADNLTVTPIYTTDATVYPQLQTSIMGSNVGIGTNAPAFKLDVAGSVNGTSLCIAGDCKTAWSQVGGAGSSQWTTSGTSVYYSAGNVGVGTTSPVRPFHVDVGAATSNGTRIGRQAAANNPYFDFMLDTTGTPYGFLSVGDNLAYRNLAIAPFGGNVGIGTAAPGARLSVGGPGANIYATDFWLENNAHIQGNETLTQGGRGRMRLGTAWGYVGLYAESSSTGAANDLVLGAGSGNVRVGPNASAGAGAMSFLVPNGNVGIGTASPASARLHVYSPSNTYLRIGAPLANQSAIAFNDDANGQDIVLYRPENTRDLSIWTATTPAAFRLTQAGSVGIGTASPRGKLEVAGGPVVLGDMGQPGWGDMILRGRVISSSNNIHLSPPGGASVYINSDYREAGGAAGPVGLNVSGNVTGAGFCIGTDCKTAWSQVGGGSASQWTTNGTSVYYNTGNVGVGTAAPGSQLFVGSGTPSAATLPGINVALGPGSGSYVAASNNTVNTFIGADGSPYGIVGTLSNHPLGLRANNTLAVTITPAGNVGVGTQSPSARLDVNGDINVSGNINAKYQDLAEWVPSSQKLAAGTVVVLDPERPNHVLASSSAYDTAVAGVVSSRPGIALGESGEGKALVATTGRVRVRVDASRGPIRIGDLLVTSATPGVAMKSEPVMVGGRMMHAPGTIIGKALEPLAGGTGEILVLLSLQ